MEEERVPILNYKPVFQRFVEANQALLACYQNIDKDELSSATPSALDAKCNREKDAVRSILASNEMTMTTVVKDRVNVLYALNEQGTKIVHKYAWYFI